jgi:DNA-binding NtrC family response regulator
MKNILIVDDNKDLLFALFSCLCDYLPGLRIVTASDGAQGRNVVEAMPIDLIVTDLTMPVMDSYLFIEHTKEHHPALPVCVMSASLPPPVQIKLQSMGVTFFLEKPFQLEDLLKVIHETLQPK